MIYLIDFGSQVTHLISRRVKELGAIIEIIDPEKAIEKIEKYKPDGIIFSGGPSSVYKTNAPTVSREIFDFNIPILGICYGLQLTAKLLGGKVIAGKNEYGPEEIKLEAGSSKFEITKKIPSKFTVWMSHGDEVIKLPKGFKVIGSTKNVKTGFVADFKRKIFGLQFHPEVEHTEFGNQLLKNFLNFCNTKTVKHEININKLEEKIKAIAKNSYVIGAISGGVDSTVAAVLAAKALGNKFIPIYVDNGLMREDTREHLAKIFKHLKIKIDIVDAEKETLKRLAGIEDPEEKRKIVGNLYIEIFEEEMEKLIIKGKDVRFLLQGTIYSDVIESKGTKHAVVIKSHHNVGGLPKNMKLKLIEPLREFYKDEVREIGSKLDLPKEFVQRQPFPGPGYAIRIRGEVTKERLEMEKQADKIVLEELEKAKLLDKVFMSFPVLTGARSTAVKGDGRKFDEVLALRVVESKDIMTSSWAHLPYKVLQEISTRIVNEINGISRVVYDISTKPPATMEWE